ncbi:MAG: hypothetical protein WCB67_10710, partial [Solirubrobacteraceae bacterium]
MSVTVRLARTGYALPPDLLGLSLEASTLARNRFAGTNLGVYLRLLGRAGILRIGGNSLDETFWTSSAERPPSWAQGTITPASLSTLA